MSLLVTSKTQVSAQLFLTKSFWAIAIFSFLVTPLFSSSFSFSQEEQKVELERAVKKEEIAYLKTTPCGKSLKNKKIALMIGERTQSGISAKQSKYGPLAEVINRKLKDLGLRIYTESEIKNQIAQAEVEAYMAGDTDGAINAAKKLSANFLLKGVISTQAQQNRVVNVAEVTVTMTFTLTSSSGKTISTVSKTYESYSGNDTFSTARRLVEEEGDEVVAKLYSDFCRKDIK
ncbi:MAG: hypothetical protein PHW07_03225 [Sulfurospirillaceae bacterium]|nr:hypothetical protein [Sulfurospirillaceae bacterium]